MLTVCTTGLYMDPARPDVSEQLAMPRRGKFRAPRASQSLRVGSSREGQSLPSLDQGNCLPQGPSASQSLRAGSSQEGNCLPQAPSTSQSLRVGSSQERPPSYLTALLSSLNSDQGNCLPQAPSVSQLPSLDQVPRVLNQPLVETVGQGCYRRLAPNTPQSVHVGSSQEKRTCNSDQGMHVLGSGIQYVVEGRWKNFRSGWTSLETSLSNERKFLISIYPCGSIDEAHAYSLAQDECKTDHTVKFHFLDGVNIVIERVQADVHSWIDNKYEYWRQNGKRKSSWWDHIRDEFIQIFRNVMVCLRHIYSKRIYSGKLIDGISVINNRETKLIWFVKAATEEEFNNGSRRDIIDLRQLMVEAVLKRYIVNARDVTKEQAAIYFSKEGLPNDLCHFIGRLYDENFVPINLDWLLDDPAFWSPDLKLGFFRVLYDIVHDQQLMDTGYASIFVSAKLEEMEIDNWEYLIPHEGRERQVLNKMRHDQKRHNKEDRGSEGNKFTTRDIFFDILLFCRNFIEHYNERLPHHKRKQKEEISLIVAKRFNGGCSMLWNSILEAWMAQPLSSKTERPEYMSRLMTDW